MKAIKLITCLLFAVATSVSAQTYRQRGVVRMITTSASSPITPVKGVQVAIDGKVSNATGSDGAFTMQVPSDFQVNGVTPDGEYILALPTKGKSYTHSPNDLDVVVTTKAQKDADYKRLYARIKAKYDEQSDQLMDLKRKYQRKLNEMQESDAEYARAKVQLDSLQTLYLDYINHEQKIDEEIKNISEDLAVTDYHSLDSIEKKTYELKCQGEWRSLSDFLHDVMRGNAAAFLQEGIDLEKQKQEELKQSQIAKATRFRLVEDAIESFKMQHLNDSVSKYYKILTDAAPYNWDYLNYAGLFEDKYMANYSKAMDYYQRAVATNPNDTLLATVYNNIGVLFHSQCDYDRALGYLEKALKISLSVLGESHIDVASIYNCIGGVYLSQGDCAKALEQLEIAYKIRQSVLDEDHPYIADSHNNIGGVYHTQGNYTQALEQYEKALRILLQVFGENHPNVAASYNNIGGAYSALGNYAKAVEHYEKALNVQLAIFSDHHPDIATSRHNLAVTYRAMGDYGKALEQCEKALMIQLYIYGEKHARVASSYNSLGIIYKYMGDNVMALEQHTKALEINMSVLGRNHPIIANAYNNIGYLDFQLQDYTKALEHYDEALRIWQNLLPENHPTVLKAKERIDFVKSKINEQ